MTIKYTLYSYVPVPNEIPARIRDYPVDAITIVADSHIVCAYDDETTHTVPMFDISGQRRLYDLVIDGQPALYPR